MPPYVTAGTAGIVLVDHQDMTVSWVRSLPPHVVVNNVRQLARLGTELEIPLLITTTMEDRVGTSIEDLQKLAPHAYADRVKRAGTLNAFLDPAFAAGVAALNRRTLVLAGLTTDICLFHTAVGALDAGYQVVVVADGCGSGSLLADQLTFDRLRGLGAVVSVGNQVLSELYQDFGSPEGLRAMQINIDEVVSRQSAA